MTRAVCQAVHIDLVIQKVLKGLAMPTGDLPREAGWPEGFDVRMDGVDVAFRAHVRRRHAMIAEAAA
ncbi:MAG: hypothetical protein JF586_12585 [Burkholderiales bacterium]|nr:hypothetical protein [Burkholderiales bacterium]